MVALLNRCRFNPTGGGLSDFVVSSAVTGFLTPAAANAVNGTVYRYAAESADRSQWEFGSGAYTSGTTTLARTTIIASSNANAKVNFSSAPQVYISPAVEDLWFGRNVIINGGFTINQRAYASSGTLAAGAYGHDRWKGGANGGDYSFTQLPSNTQVTIAANKSIIQVVENVNVVGGTYVLSWSGTAVARVGLNSSTPSGNFAASPIIITGQNAGTVLSVEFTGANALGGSSLATNTGTLSTVQCEQGTISTPFEFRHYGREFDLCARYFQKLSVTTIGTFQTAVGQTLHVSIRLFPMRTTPTVTLTGGALNNCTITMGGASPNDVRLDLSSLAAGQTYAIGPNLACDAEL